MKTDTLISLLPPGLPRPLQLYVHGPQDQVISARLKAEGVWEPYETELILSLLNPGDVFVDVGANIGYFSVIAGAIVGDSGAVHAFEPHPENYALLCANAALNDLGGSLVIYPVGLSDVAQQASLFLSADNSGDHQIYASSEVRPSHDIQLLQGSDVLRDQLDRIDLVKVDTQGSETRVIAGLMPLLETLSCAPRILIELTPHSLREAGSSGRELIALLAQLYQSFWIIDHLEHRLAATTAQELSVWCDGWEKVPESQGFMNILVGPPPESTCPPVVLKTHR